MPRRLRFFSRSGVVGCDKWKQAGAELCQAKDQLGLPAEAKLILEVVYTLDCAVEKTFNSCQIYFADFHLFRWSWLYQML